MSSQLLATASRHPFSFAALADKLFLATTESAFKSRWTNPLCSFAESAVVRCVWSSSNEWKVYSNQPIILSTLNHITEGRLTIESPDQTYVFPSPSSSHPSSSSRPDVQGVIRVLKPTFWLRLATMADMGFAEAYMFQEIDCDDLIAVFSVSQTFANSTVPSRTPGIIILPPLIHL